MLREDLSRNFGFLLTDVARLMRTIYDRRVKSLGLTRSQWWVLNHLFRGDGVTQTELADTLEIEKPTLGRLLDRLQAKGWVRREADARDGRVWRVYLTAEVEPAMRTLRTVAAELRRDALAGLSAAERERFVDTLLGIRSNLVRMQGGAPETPASRTPQWLSRGHSGPLSRAKRCAPCSSSACRSPPRPQPSTSTPPAGATWKPITPTSNPTSSR